MKTKVVQKVAYFYDQTLAQVITLLDYKNGRGIMIDEKLNLLKSGFEVDARLLTPV